MRDHERIEELLAARALDGLDPEDEAVLERELAAHGPDCEECLRLEREHEDTAARLAFALEPVPVREWLADEVVARAVGEAEPAGTGVPVERGPIVPAPLVPSPTARAWRPLVAAAAAIVLFAGGWVVRDLTAPEAPAGPSADFLAQATLVRFEGSGGGELAVAVHPARAEAYVLGTAVPELPEGRTYELWLIRDGQPASAGCFRPDDGTVVLRVDADLGGTDALAVTEEADACPDAPTTDPLGVADLSSVETLA